MPHPSTSRRPLRVLCAAAFLASGGALLAACGGGDAATERLTTQEWVARADAVCRAAEEEVDALRAPDPSEQQAFAEYMASIARIGERQLGELRALRPPEAAETDYAALIDISEKQVGVAKDIADAAAAGDSEAVTELVAEARSLQARADSIVARYPFEDCGTTGA